MEPEIFEIGDTVQLNSGGPNMTVTAIAPDGYGLEAIWFDGAQAYTGNFKLACITRICSREDGMKRIANLKGGQT